jgi:Flp pilus assembly protein TadG
MIEERRARAVRRRQSGLAMVEFAISVPVLLLLMFGTFEFGHFLIQYSVLNDAVRNASRYVAGKALGTTAGTLVTGADWDALVTKGKNLAVYGNIAGTGSPVLPSLNDTNIATITVTPDPPNRNIAVLAAYKYQPLFGAAIPTFMGGSISTAFTLNISITMRAL